MQTLKKLITIATVGIALFPLTNQAQTWVTNGLVAYYPFNGNANDASGSGNNGYTINTIGTTNRFGQPNAALYFNATNASVAISNQFLNIGSDYTLSMWFCTFDASWQFQELINSRPNPAIDLMYNAALHGGDLYLDFSIGTGTDWLQPTQQHGPKQNYLAHQWYHIVAIKSGSTYSTFVDAVEDASFQRNPGSRLVGLQIGSTLYNAGDPWPGTGVYGNLDDVRVYNRALSASEVAQLYASESGPPTCSPHKATATAVMFNEFVVDATVTDGGCGYTNAPTVLIQGGGGTGATATATITDDQVTAIHITNAGYGYTSVPKIVIGSPPFVPTVSIAVSKVKVTQNVVLGRKYVLESSADLGSWTAAGPEFIAESESIVSEFDVEVTGRFFRIRQVQ